MAIAQPDAGVLRKAQSGDERAFALLVRQYERAILNYVFRAVGNRERAEDLTQDIFLRAFRSLPRFSFRAKFTTWLFAIAKNRILDEIRSARRGPVVVDVDEVELAVAQDSPIEERLTVDALWRAVAQLDADLRMPLLLRDVAGLSYQEIAEALEISMPTVKWRIYAAREQVKAAVDTGAAPEPTAASQSRRRG